MELSNREKREEWFKAAEFVRRQSDTSWQAQEVRAEALRLYPKPTKVVPRRVRIGNYTYAIRDGKLHRIWNHGGEPEFWQESEWELQQARAIVELFNRPTELEELEEP